MATPLADLLKLMQAGTRVDYDALERACTDLPREVETLRGMVDDLETASNLIAEHAEVPMDPDVNESGQPFEDAWVGLCNEAGSAARALAAFAAWKMP